jgi:hypothetical protein
MTFADQMIRAAPVRTGYKPDQLAECIRACVDCAQACVACADASLGEDHVVELRRSITLCLNCADVCDATGRVLSRQTAYDASVSRATLESCLTLCRACAEECDRHAAMHEHHRICAEVCRACERSCEQMLAA